MRDREFSAVRGLSDRHGSGAEQGIVDDPQTPDPGHHCRAGHHAACDRRSCLSWTYSGSRLLSSSWVQGAADGNIQDGRNRTPSKIGERPTQIRRPSLGELWLMPDELATMDPQSSTAQPPPDEPPVSGRVQAVRRSRRRSTPMTRPATAPTPARRLPRLRRPWTKPPTAEEPPSNKHWYVVKVQSGREESIKEAIERRVKIEGLEEYLRPDHHPGREGHRDAQRQARGHASASSIPAT